MPPATKAQKKLLQAAKDSFNRTYAGQYGEERWEQLLYPALLAPTRYASLINCYAATDLPAVFTEEQTKGLQDIRFPSHPGSSTEGSLVAYQTATETPFPPPQPHPSNRRMTHWNLDAASLLAVAVLGPKPGDKVLDLCAAPGGKSVSIAQLLRPSGFDEAAPSLAGGCLHSNELNPGRNKRLAANLASYLPAPLFRSGEVRVLRLDAAAAGAERALPLGPGAYDRVLLDAPCSGERHVVHAEARSHRNGGNASCPEMSSWRSRQSQKAARTQAALLLTALRAARPGGSVLYATCSLSGDENDGAVGRALEALAKERRKLTAGAEAGWDVAVRSGDLELGSWAERTTHGWLVLPDHPSGGKWGPLFLALLEKVAA